MKQPVWICLCTNEAYARYCATTINSVLYHRSEKREYHFIVLTSRISKRSLLRFKKLEQSYEEVEIQVINMEKRQQEIYSKVNAYYTVEANYRAFLFDQMFDDLERVLYLDCDILCQGDVGELYDTDLEGNCAGAVTEYGFFMNYYLEDALFYNDRPYNYKDYITKIVGITDETKYFNTGVMVFDLKKCRSVVDGGQLRYELTTKRYVFSDQDCLNRLLKGHILFLPAKWNYQQLLPYYQNSENEKGKEIYQSIFCDNPQILHFTSGRKPWNDTSLLWYKKYKEFLLD